MPDPLKKVNLFVQVLLNFIPFGGLYAHYRIMKVRLGIAVAIISVASFIVPVLLIPDYNDPLADPDQLPEGYLIATSIGLMVWYFLPIICLVKWSMNWNDRIDQESTSLKG